MGKKWKKILIDRRMQAASAVVEALSPVIESAPEPEVASEPVVEVAPEPEEAPEPAVEAEEAPAPRKRSRKSKRS
jgi:hypothetical protein